MALKAIVEKLDDVPEAMRGEYKEQTDSKTNSTVYVLDIDGPIDLHPSARALKNENAARRISERTALDKLKNLEPYAALGDLSEIQAKLDKIAELELAANGKLDDNKINQLVEGRIGSKTAPLQRQIEKLTKDLQDREIAINEFKSKEVTRTIHDQIREAIVKSKGFQSAAMEDALMFGERHLTLDENGNVVTKNDVGVTPGVDPVVWLGEMQQRKPHWWGSTGGGGANGNQGNGNNSGQNPFTFENWNVTAQGRLVAANKTQAENFAKAAGTTIGGRRPAPKK